MANAWLDSLSEDWVSQPRSESPALSRPQSSSTTSNSQTKFERIPKYDTQKHTWAVEHSPLGDRSLNDINIPFSQPLQRQPSKLRQLAARDGRCLSRALSGSTTGSVQHNTIQHKSRSLSPRNIVQTPEWKRRLLQGGIAYGEQRDLFSPAGLENIFKPPPSENLSPAKSPIHTIFDTSVVVPSSPPLFTREQTFTKEDKVEEEKLEEKCGDEIHDAPGSEKPRASGSKHAGLMSYSKSAEDISRNSSIPPNQTPRNQKHKSYAENEATRNSTIRRREIVLEENGRAVSSKTDIGNEGFSPLYVLKHDIVGETIDQAAWVLPMDEIYQRLEKIQDKPRIKSTKGEDQKAHVLSADTTEDLTRKGKSVNLQRGGHCQEGSFQRHVLSPALITPVDESALLPEESMQASTPKQLPDTEQTRDSDEYPSLQTLPLASQSVNTSPVKPGGNYLKNAAVSPLKLFGTHDTFTNQKLLRRLSQFEGDTEALNENEDSAGSSREPRRHGPNDPFAAVSSQKDVIKKPQIYHNTPRNISSFGDGDLDNFQFSELSYESERTNHYEHDKENASLPVLNPSKQKSFKFSLDPSALDDNAFINRRHTKYANTTKVATSSPRISIDASAPQKQEDLQTPRKWDGEVEGKRLPKSPLKDPTPKRRRTSQRTELNLSHWRESKIDYDKLKETHRQMQSVVGRKRKDGRHEDDHQTANSKTLALRQILYPRSPAPSQKGNQVTERSPVWEIGISSLGQAKLAQDPKIARVQAELDSTQLLRMEAALGKSPQMQNESRKGSVTTQDFLDEAKKIMAGIRGKARPQSGLASLDESAIENDHGAKHKLMQRDHHDSYEESTQEPFSRPPSRDGAAPLPRLPHQREDPAVLDHLRKYQEENDFDAILLSSMKSLALVKEASLVAREVNKFTDETITSRRAARVDFTGSDPPNIRISENPESKKRKHSFSSSQTGSSDIHIEDRYHSQASNASSGQLSSHSIPTGSSRGSESRRVIAPHTVSHLIPGELAGMVFDRVRNIWVKRKLVSDEKISHDFVASEETEEDPFGDIPDLSVDETVELQRTKSVAVKQMDGESVAQEQQSREKIQASVSLPRCGQVHESKAALEPVTRDAPLHKTNGFSSKGSRMEIDARLASWQENEIAVKKKSAMKSHRSISRHCTLIHTKSQEHMIEEEVEREISIHEDRLEHPGTPKRRNITITFSSPLASIMKTPKREHKRDSRHEQEDVDIPYDDNLVDADTESIVSTDTHNRCSTSTQYKSSRSISRKLSIGRHGFSTRPVSRIEERDEDFDSPGKEDYHNRSISVVLASPNNAGRVSSVVLTTPMQVHEPGTLTLTPLSEFTVHNADGSLGLDVSYVAKNQRCVMGNDRKRTLSLSIKHMVEKIAEVEPYEPFWEHLKEIDLKNKDLVNLHKLDEFCEHLEDLNVSHNKISHLDGIPRTVRNLRITNNCLTDITAWGSLMNLQYVDVSNNNLESLSGLRGLVHIRSLRADRNKIVSLDGIDQLDGLLNLRLRGNSIQSLDFRGAKLPRLTDLDLQGNHISSIETLQQLESLTSLNLVDNHLSEFSVGGSEVLRSIKHLRLSGNNLEFIDVSQFPNLRLLYLDRNRLGTVTGLPKTKYLDSLSMREQRDSTLNTSFICEAFEIRKLFLSGNLLSKFEPRSDFLNLQYLELANCGLESLPDNFGSLLANVRVLNLNFNALTNYRSLFGIMRLKKLYLAGNRLTGLDMMAKFLKYFPTISQIDFRGNPITMGFYPWGIESRVTVHQLLDTDETERQEPYALTKADGMKDDKYTSCLDMRTRIKRRLYEMIIIGSTCRLKYLDGLAVDESILKAKDKVYDCMVESGFITPRAPGDVFPNVEEPAQQQEDERWQAEDSFA